MTIEFTPLYQQTHSFSEGQIEVSGEFTGNLLGIKVTTKPEYVETNQVIGQLVQTFGTQSKTYALRAGSDVIRLDLPETGNLVFFPTEFLSDSYSLELAYTTVGAVIDGANATPIPVQILELPNRVTNLETFETNATNELNTYASAVTELQSSVAALGSEASAISTLNTEVSTLGDRLTTAESTIATLQSSESGESTGGSSSIDYIPTSSNLVLESNKPYVSTVANLEFTLSLSPVIGDAIDLATGNFNLKVFQNTGDRILNLSTLSPSGSGSGIILKPYSDVRLTYKEAGLWVSSYRSRTINNWQSATVESNQPIAYTPSDNHAGENGSSSAGINDNVTVGGGGFANSYFARVNQVDFTLTLASEIELDGFDYYAGQGNTTGGTQSNSPNTLNVYSDSGKTNLLGSFTLSKTADTKQSFALNLSGNAYSSYVFSFLNTEVSDRLSFMELDLFGKIMTGGEIVAT